MNRQYQHPNLHQLAEERSIAYHQAIGMKIQAHPELIEQIRARLQKQQESSRYSHAEHYWAQAWLEILNKPMGVILAFLVNREERAKEMRQSTPFAGVLTARERWKIHKELGEHWRSGSEKRPA